MIKRLLYLNGIAILSVLLFHGAGWGITAMFAWAHRYLPVASPDYSQVGSIDYFLMRIIEQLVVFSIPAFLFVSGYFVAFIAGQRKIKDYWNSITSRIKFLILPYLFWSLIFIAMRSIEGRPFNLGTTVISLLTGATTPAYYFVPLLIQYYLLSVLLVPIARKNWKLLLLVTGIFQIGVHILQYPIVLGMTPGLTEFYYTWFPKWFFPVRLFWFCAGLVMGFHISQFKDWVFRLRPLWIGGSAILFLIGIVEWEWLIRQAGNFGLEMQHTLVDALYAVTVILALLSLMDKKVPFASMVSDVGVKSFGIYLVHVPAMEYFNRAVYHLAPNMLAFQSVLMVLSVAVGLDGPLLLMVLVRRSSLKRLYSYIFG